MQVHSKHDNDVICVHQNCICMFLSPDLICEKKKSFQDPNPALFSSYKY